MITNRIAVTPMLTTSEVAAILNVHINTIRRWSNQGTLKAINSAPGATAVSAAKISMNFWRDIAVKTTGI